MSQLNDAYADLSVEDRILLFESHIKPFGSQIHNRMIFGKKYETKYPDLPNPLKYEVNKAKDFLRQRPYVVKIYEPLNLYKKPPSQRPEYNDNWMKPFGYDLYTKNRLSPPKDYLNLKSAVKNQNQRKQKKLKSQSSSYMHQPMSEVNSFNDPEISAIKIEDELKTPKKRNIQNYLLIQNKNDQSIIQSQISKINSDLQIPDQIMISPQ